MLAAALVAQPAIRSSRSALVTLVAAVAVCVPSASALRARSERRRLEDELDRRTNHDHVTGLPNRSLFVHRVRQVLLQRGSGPCAVLLVDLDQFRDVNDTLGHTAGDGLLRAVAPRMISVLRAGDTVARLGGDEFGVLLEGVSGPEEAVVVADRILDVLQAPFLLPAGAGTHEPVVAQLQTGTAHPEPAAISRDGATGSASTVPGRTAAGSNVLVTASVGIGVAPPGAGISADQLLRDAGLALSTAKEEGRSRARLFHPAMHAHLVERVELKADLRQAAERGELVLHYQPLVHIASGSVVGVEALVRWDHPRRGLVQPMQFIPLAESSGLIVGLGRWVVEAACAEGRKLVAAAGTAEPLHVSVNLSARQLQDRELVRHVAGALSRSGLPPERLVLEITESVVAGNLEATRTALEALRSLGVRIAIDDFGAGYSSLQYLRSLPVDILKIDRAFVNGLGRTPRDSALADAIVTLGHSLGLATVAEGIESETQLDHLHRAGCDLGQGYLFAAPMPPAELRQFLSRPEAVAS